MEDAPGLCISATAGPVFSMVWVRATRVVITAALLAVASLSIRVDGQVVRPDPTAASSPNQTDIAPGGATVPGERIERMLARMSPELNPQLHSLNLSEYVIVVGRQPEVSLLGSEPDLGGGAPGFGPPTHLEMMATVAPSDIQAAAGADALGIATAALLDAGPQGYRCTGVFERDVVAVPVPDELLPAGSLVTMTPRRVDPVMLGILGIFCSGAMTLTRPRGCRWCLSTGRKANRSRSRRHSRRSQSGV